GQNSLLFCSDELGGGLWPFQKWTARSLDAHLELGVKGLVQAMQTQAHTQAALQAQMESQALSAACRQEGEMEQYLEEKKASQKRPAAPFQRQNKKKTAYQTPQCPVAASNTQRVVALSLDLDHLSIGNTLDWARDSLSRPPQELGVNALTPRSRCASSDLAVHSWNG
ncbi:hypothetical protein Taro_047152, partial [Colocasia esculenta]|nr:hypothetical protein [Colocasia esculenta]